MSSSIPVEETKMTTLCYLEQRESYLMLHRVKKENDINKDKWIGLGGHFLEGESPEECICREFKEECGVTILNERLRGYVTFVSDVYGCVYMFVFTASKYEGQIDYNCNEGTLEWVRKDRIFDLPIWEGDKIFLDLLNSDTGFFSLKLCYQGDNLVEAVLNGEKLALPYSKLKAGGL